VDRVRAARRRRRLAAPAGGRRPAARHRVGRRRAARAVARRPDSLAARWNVDRFADTGRIDTAYLSMLSADAVPALDRLPEPQRWCVLHGREVTDDGWTTWNRARAASDRTLRDRPPVTPRPAQQASACGDLDLRAHP
jgi:hypothetical protein